MTVIEPVYKKNFLTHVIFRVDYPQILELTERKPPNKIQEALIDVFPKAKEITKGEIEYQLNLSQLSVKHKDSIAWAFSNKLGTKRVFVDSDFTYIEYKKYRKFDGLYKDIELVYSALKENYPVKNVNRIGLRYINQIKLKTGDPFDWKNYLNAELYSTTSAFLDKKANILRHMHRIDFLDGENKIIFNFGTFNSDYPSPIVRKEFILDYDCSVVEEMPFNDIYVKAKEFNSVITRWFEYSIQDDLRKEMGALSQ